MTAQPIDRLKTELSMRIRIALIFLAGLSACRATPPPAFQRSVEVLGGREIVTISGELEAVEKLDTLLKLGSLDGERDDSFSWLSSVLVGPQQEVYVADLGSKHLLVFDVSGRLRATIGRQGEGPGEFETPFSIALSGDRLLALDHGNARLIEMDLNGVQSRQWPAAATLAATPVDFRLYDVGAGRVFLWGYEATADGPMPAWFEIPSEGDLIARPRSRPVNQGAADYPNLTCQMGRGFSWFPHPFAPRTLSHPLRSGGTVSANTDEYTLLIESADGELIREIRREIPAQPIPNETWDQVQGRVDEWLADKERSGCAGVTLARPPEVPPIRTLLVDRSNLIWVERDMGSQSVWEVFDEKGQVVTAVSAFDFDRDRTVPFLTDELLAWVTRMDFDVPGVVVARREGPHR